MRLLVVGADSNYAIENSYVKYFAETKEITKVDFFKAQNRFLAYYNKSTFNKVSYRLGFSSVLKDINKELIEEIEKNKPDVVFVFKGMEIFPETLEWARKQGVRLANYNPDNPFIFSGRGSGNSNVTKSIGLYDLHFTYDREVKDRLEREWVKPCILLPFGFDLADDVFHKFQSQNEVMKLCFLGGPDKYRASFIDRLARKNILIDVYGPGWEKFVTHKNIKLHNAVYGDMFWETLNKYRIQLNLLRPHNLRSHNMRSFEIPAVGGIQLAPDTIDHRTYFNPGKEIEVFDSLKECLEQPSKKE